MLPMCRTPGDVYTLPQFDVSPSEVEGFLDELRALHAAFRECFGRSEPRDHFFRYMVGQLRTLERKSIEPIALQVNASRVRAMQRGLSDVSWDEPRMLKIYHHQVADEMGESDGVLMIDETGFVKKGKDSAGVARQYCGTLGKVENCQVGVFVAYASRQGYALVDKRLFLSELWFTEAYATGRTKCAVPAETILQTKPQLAATMMQEIHAAGILPFRSIVADCLYGNSPEFWTACAACVGTVAFVATPGDTRCWLQPLPTQLHTYKYRGEMRTKRVVAPLDAPPRSVAQIARELSASCWYQRTVSEGAKGPITYEFARKRVRLCKDGQPAQTVWLVMKRSLGEHPTYWYYISNAPVSAPLRLLVWLSGIRWAVEQCFAETKTELGMAHYELRKYPGWHHHMLTCMLAHFFLWRVKIHLGEKSTSPDSLPGATASGGHFTPQNLSSSRSLTLSTADTAAQPQSLSCTSQAM
jgi:SRSO17 transposase